MAPSDIDLRCTSRCSTGSAVTRGSSLPSRSCPESGPEFPVVAGSVDSWLKSAGGGQVVDVSPSVIGTLFDETERRAHDETSIVQLLGRHLRQEPHFDFEPLDWVAAAKTCGHVNHAGKSSGDIQWHYVKGSMPLDRFQSDFGLPPKATVRRAGLALARARLTDPRFVKSWVKKTTLAKHGRRLVRRFR